ncbi:MULTISPECIES: MBL fold metallo-hydrolase [unclassified Chitinophaga]|uniref:MBL fold metallo-hydrolase n=1 Tax=unclassified Chitinophaga TaxID=2619133 RepID=UPI0009D3E7BC|nr:MULTISPECIES: MBL fold metallo-hydrolase [unclassified Chitinophaga]OMP77628.1 MBL fold metallo-hydrolase [[Flexibacter] sp. ATCC 35208]WPV68194.1 MBL fold metallo-hydrolase [Chitinophaga sp. LS1]
MARIIPLSEGSFTVDATKQFVPYNPSVDTMQQRTGGSLLVEIQPFLVITNQDFILFDTGLGLRNKDGVLQIHQHLIDNGVNPMEITKVLMSHLHKDHSGGVSAEDPITGQRQLTFPHATYYVNRQEFQYALENDGKSYLGSDISLLQNYDNVVFTEGDGTIDDYISYWVTGGHCPYHQVFLINDEDGKVFFGGDEAPQMSFMIRRFAAKYDYDGKRGLELREQFKQRGAEEDWTFLYYHDTKTPFNKFPNKHK